MTYTRALEREVENIKSTLQRAGISIAELARRAKVSQPHVNNILNGVRGLTPRVADKLIRALRSDDT